MRQKLIGTFDFYDCDVDLIAMPNDSGGWIYYHPDRILVGLKYDCWDEAVATLLHECFEFAAARKGVRFERCGKFNRSHDDYLFAFDHPQFSDICSRVACFVTPALPKLAAAYRKNQNTKKSKAKKKPKRKKK